VGRRWDQEEPVWFTLTSNWGCDRHRVSGLWQGGSEESHDFFFFKMEKHGLTDNLFKTEFYVAEELHRT